MTLPTATPPAGDTGQQEPPFPPAPIEELLRLLVKAVRAHQLYLPNNPVYRGAIDAVRGAFGPVWERTDEVALRFTETEIRWHGVPVLAEPGKSADSLPWTFYKDGIREVRLTVGFEEEELAKLLEILQRLRKAAPEEDDLLTMLWEADFAKLRYRYVDIGAEGGGAGTLADGSDAGDPASPDQVRAAATEEADAQAPSGVVNMQDFDATLYFLDEHELDYLRGEIEREYTSDLRQNVLAMLFDIYEAQTEPAIRDEVTGLVETMLLLLLAGGHLHDVAYLLAEARQIVTRAPELTPEQRDRMGRMPDRLSAPEPLGQLLQALDEAADLPPRGELIELFGELTAPALGTIFVWLTRMQNPQIRELVQQAADRLAAAHTAELVRLIESPDATVVRESVRRAGAMRAAPAVAALARILADSKDASLRLAAVQALAEIGSPGALQALDRSIEDPDRDVRVAAVRTLGAKKFRGVFKRLDDVVRGRDLRSADLTERMAFFEAFGAMCGDAGVPFLDEILNRRGLFGRREDPELRACAAMALGRIGTGKATESLQRATGEKDIVVRNAVSRALRGESA